MEILDLFSPSDGELDSEACRCPGLGTLSGDFTFGLGERTGVEVLLDLGLVDNVSGFWANDEVELSVSASSSSLG